MKKELPILACTLQPEDQRTRGKEIEGLLKASLVGYSKGEASLELHFRPGEETLEAVNNLVAQESECCSFLSFRIDPQQERLTLEISGPPGAEPVLDSFFSLFPLDLRDFVESRDVPSPLE